jgi:hypothetical protein
MHQAKANINKVDKIKMNEFLSKHSRKRNLDSAFINWFQRQDSSNPEKTVQEWESLLIKFFNE